MRRGRARKAPAAGEPVCVKQGGRTEGPGWAAGVLGWVALLLGGPWVGHSFLPGSPFPICQEWKQ